MARIPTFPYGAGPTTVLPPKPKPKPPQRQPAAAADPSAAPTLLQQAQDIASAGIDPYRAEIIRQQQQAQAQAQAAAKQQQDISAALAQILQQVRPNIEGTYRAAASDQTAFAKGFSDGMQQQLGGSADQTNALLKSLGAPEGQQIGPGSATAAGDVLYGLGGVIPGQTFSREGAAFASAAGFLPATTQMQGLREAQGILSKGRETDADYNQQLLDLELKRPGLVQDALGDLEKQQFEYEKWVAEQKYRQATLNKPRIFGSSSSGYFALDPATGKVQEIVQGKATPTKLQVFGSSTSGYYAINPETGQIQQIVPGQPGAPKVKIVGSDKTGRYAYDPATGQKTLIIPPSKTTRPKVDAKTLNSAKRFAAATAAEAYKGFWTEQTARAAFPGRVYESEKDARKAVKPQGNVGYSVAVLNADGEIVGYDNWNPPMNYQAALQEMLKMPEVAALPAGERLRVVQEALNHFYKRGERGRPTRSIQERNAYQPTAERAAVAVEYALEQIGQPYQWGGEDRSEGGFDCSGLIDWAYKKAGIDFPGRLTTYSAMKLGRAVDPNREQLQPGDLIITNDGNHMVMYVGNGEVVAASGSRDEQRGNRGGKVVRQPVDYHLQRAVAVRRVVGGSASREPPAGTAAPADESDPWFGYGTKAKWVAAGSPTPAWQKGG